MPEKPHVIFLDSDRHNLERYAWSLQSKAAEWDIVFATSQDAALADFRNYPSAILIVDAVPPGVAGLEVLQIAKGLNPAARVFVVSESVETHGAEVLSKALNAGAARVFTKPFQMEDMIDAIEEFLGRK